MNWANVSDESVRELHRQGEACLDGTIKLALAADQRATTLCGVLGAGAVALMAAAATVLAGAHVNVALVSSALVCALLLLIASLFCALACRPGNFHVGGYEPRSLIVSGSDHMWMLRYAIDDLQSRITANRGALDASANLLNLGMCTAGLAVITGAVVFVCFAIAL